MINGPEEKLSLQSAQRSDEPAESESKVAQALGLTDEALGSARGLAMSLRPGVLDALGLVAGIRWLAGRMAEQGAFEVTLDTNGNRSGWRA